MALDGYKNIKIKADTHRLLKVQSANEGETMIDFLHSLIAEDKETKIAWESGDIFDFSSIASIDTEDYKESTSHEGEVVSISWKGLPVKNSAIVGRFLHILRRNKFLEREDLQESVENNVSMTWFELGQLEVGRYFPKVWQIEKLLELFGQEENMRLTIYMKYDFFVGDNDRPVPIPLAFIDFPHSREWNRLVEEEKEKFSE